MLTQPALQRPALLQGNRAAIFIDAANLFYAAQELGIYIEYRKLKTFLAANFFLTGAWYYTGVDSIEPTQRSFLSQLRQYDYEVIAKEVVKRADGSRKANLDVKIALDMMKFVNFYDTAVLVSGDGDLQWVVEELQNQGKRVVVVGLDSRTSYELRDLADQYIELASIKHKISNVPRPYAG